MAMAEQSGMSLHPALHKLAVNYRRRWRLLGLLAFLLVAGVVLFAITVALTGQSLGDLLTFSLVGLLALPMMMLLMVVMHSTDRAVTRELAAANQLISTCSPQAVRLTPIKSASLGHLVALHLPVEGPVYAVVKRFMRPLPQQEMEVQLYGRSFTRHSPLIALQPNGIALLGTVVDPERIERRYKIIRIVVWTIQIVVIAYLLYEKYSPSINR